MRKLREVEKILCVDNKMLSFRIKKVEIRSGSDRQNAHLGKVAISLD